MKKDVEYLECEKSAAKGKSLWYPKQVGRPEMTDKEAPWAVELKLPNENCIRKGNAKEDLPPSTTIYLTPVLSNTLPKCDL